MVLTTGLLSLSIHEALTFDGTEICLHPELFDSPTGGGAGSSMTGSTRQSVLIRPNPTTSTTTTVPTVVMSSGINAASQPSAIPHNMGTAAATSSLMLPSLLPSDGRVLMPTNSEDSRFQGSTSFNTGSTGTTATATAAVPQKRMEAGDMIMIRVWDPLPSNNERRTGTTTTTPIMSSSSSRKRHSNSHVSYNNNNTIMSSDYYGALNNSIFAGGQKSSGNASVGASSLQYSVDSTKSSPERVSSGVGHSTVTTTTTTLQGNNLTDAVSVLTAERVKEEGIPSSFVSPVPTDNNTVPKTVGGPPVKMTIADGSPPPVPIRRSYETNMPTPKITPGSGSSSGIPRPSTVQRSRTLPPHDISRVAPQPQSPNMPLPATTAAANNVTKPRHVREISDMTVESTLGATTGTTSTTTLDGNGYISDSTGLLDLGMVGDDDDGEDELEDAVLAKIATTHTLRLAWVMLISEKSLTSLKGSARTQVSLLRQVADLYNLSAYDMVTVSRMERQEEVAAVLEEEVSADFVIVTIKDQFISRGDMHFFQKSLIGSWIYKGQRLNETTRGIKAHAREIRHGNHLIQSGIVTEDTKITFRSRSARIIWLIQISSEMWEFACPYESSSTTTTSATSSSNVGGGGGSGNSAAQQHSDGDDEERSCEIYFDKFISFVYKIFAKWKALEVTHSLTIVFFSRSYLNSEHATASEPSSGGFIRQDVYGRLYEDHYRTIVMNEKRTDWDSLVVKIKEEFIAYPFEVGWNNSFGERGRRPSNASQGNVLEAINVTLNLLQFHFLDRDLHRTGNSLVVVSAGSGVFEVDRELAGITYQRMMDNGIGSDMLSLAKPPLHIAPFFLYNNDYHAVGTRGVDANEAYYEIPHWMHLSFVSYDNDNLDSIAQSSGQHQKAATGTPQRPRCVLKLDGQLEVAGNGFLLPTLQEDEDVVENGNGQSVKSSSTQPKSLSAGEEAKERTKLKIETQTRQLIADRDFHDILEACKPRDAGHSLPSALAALLTMKRNSDESKKNELASRLKNAATPKEGDQVRPGRPELKEWGAVDFDSVGARLMRSARSKLGKRPESPQEGSDRERSDFSDNDKLSPASSIASHMSTVLGRSYESMFLMSSAQGADNMSSSATHGIQLQKSPSIEFDQGLLDGSTFQSDDSLSSGDEEGAKSDSRTNGSTKKKSENDSTANETRLRKMMAAFDASYFDDPVETSVTAANRQRQSLFTVAQESSDTISSPSKVAFSTRQNSDRTETKLGGGLDAALTQYKKVADAPRDSNNNSGWVKRAGSSGRIGSVVNTVRPSFSDDSNRQLQASAAGVNPLNPDQPPLRIDAPLFSRLGGRSFSSQEAYAPKMASSFSSFGSDRRVHGINERHRSEMLPVTLELLETPANSSQQHRSASTVKRIDDHNRRRPRGGERWRRSGAVSRRKKIFNPFRQQDEDEVLSKKSHNRRRWSHVFPLGEVEFKRHSGPLWKSLCQPAILPLTIDYYPTQQELTSTFTFSYHSVSVKDVENMHYSSPSELLMEMVRQRIVQDYQLVPQTIVQESSRRGEAQVQVRHSSTRASAKTLGRNFFPSLPTQSENSGVVQKVLSMGHRIQVIVYDPSTESITVTRYMQKRAKNDDATYTYRYAMYSPALQKFCTVIQTFTKYSPPYVWNTLDAILCGIVDKALEEGLRFRRLIFSLIPERFTDFASEEEYIGKFRRLIEYLSKLREKDDVKHGDLDIKIISSSSTPVEGEAFRKGITDSMKRFNVLLRKGKRDPLEWIEVAVDSIFDTKRSYRIVFNWLVASSQKVETQVQLLQRRCVQFGLSIVSMTQTSVSRNLFLNPFVMPSIFCVRNKEKADLLEDYLLERDFVRDGMHFTDPNILDCIPDGDDYDVPKYKNGRRMNIASMQYVHRSGTLSIRLLRDKQDWGLLVAIENLLYTLDNEESQQKTYKILRDMSTLETS